MRSKTNDPISAELSGIKALFIELRLFSTLLDSIIFFLVSYMVIQFFLRIDYVYALVPVAVYMLVRLFTAVRERRTIEKVSGKYPSLDCRLQTAYEYRNKPNLIAERLVDDVSGRMDKVRSSSFVSGKEISLRVFMIIFLLFVFLSASFIDIKGAGLRLREDLMKQLEEMDLPLDGGGEGQDRFSLGGSNSERSNYSNKDDENKIGGISGGNVPGFNEGPLPGAGGGAGESGNEDIYGAPTSVRIEGRNIEMEVHPEYGGQIELPEPDDFDRVDAESTVFQDIESARTPDQEPVEYEEVIRKYFEKLTEEEVK